MGRPSRRATIWRAAWRPACMATGASCGSKRTLLVGGGGDIPDGEDLGTARHRQVPFHHDPSAAADLQTELRSQPARLHAGRPHQGVGADARAVGQVHPGRLDPLHGPAEEHLHTELAQLGQRLGRQRWSEGAEHAVGHLDQHHPGAAHVDPLEVLGQHRAEQLGEPAGELDARRPTTDDHDGEETVLHHRPAPARRARSAAARGGAGRGHPGGSSGRRRARPHPARRRWRSPPPPPSPGCRSRAGRAPRPAARAGRGRRRSPGP